MANYDFTFRLYSGSIASDSSHMCFQASAIKSGELVIGHDPYVAQYHLFVVRPSPIWGTGTAKRALVMCSGRAKLSTIETVAPYRTVKAQSMHRNSAE